MATIPSDLLNVIIRLGIIVGAIQCFFGYRIFKIILALTGFIIGGALAGSVGYSTAGDEMAAFVTAIIGGLIGAGLLYFLYFIGVFLVGAFLGVLVGAIFYGASGGGPEPVVLLLLAGAGGVLGLIFQKFIIILATSFGGSWSVVVGVAYFTIRGFDPVHFDRFLRSGGTALHVFLLCWLVLGISGLLVQYTSLPSPRETAMPDEK